MAAGGGDANLFICWLIWLIDFTPPSVWGWLKVAVIKAQCCKEGDTGLHRSWQYPSMSTCSCVVESWVKALRCQQWWKCWCRRKVIVHCFQCARESLAWKLRNSVKERGQSKVCKMESTSQTVSGQSVLETQEIQNKDYNKHKNQASWEKSKVEALVRGGGGGEDTPFSGMCILGFFACCSCWSRVANDFETCFICSVRRAKENTDPSQTQIYVCGFEAHEIIFVQAKTDFKGLASIWVSGQGNGSGTHNAYSPKEVLLQTHSHGITFYGQDEDGGLCEI